MITPSPATAADTSREAPWPVRTLTRKMVEYIARAPQVWVEGQIAQLSARPGSAVVFLTLRDPSADVSLQVSVPRTALQGMARPPAEGDRVVVHGRFDFYAARGSLTFRVDQVHPVGIGELLARLERLRQLLAAEGLTAPERKRPLPFLPRTVGLVTGRASAAESDVLSNARARWPAVRFRVENTVVQGPTAVPLVIDALRRLDADPEVDVIILARGGGSVEDLLPFSDETLCRAVAACRTPVISAIGHQPDHPIVDDVADVRCSTPTDAGKRVVPDAAAELRHIELCRHRARRALIGWVDTAAARLSRLTSAAVLADPFGPLDRRSEEVDRLAARGLSVVTGIIDTGLTDLRHRAAQLSVLGPAATLARGYAVVQSRGVVLRAVADAPAGVQLRIRLGDGALAARSEGPERAESSAAGPTPTGTAVGSRAGQAAGGGGTAT